MLEGAFFRVLSINAPRGLRCVSDDVSNLPQAVNDQQQQAAGACPFGLQMHALQGPSLSGTDGFLPTNATVFHHLTRTPENSFLLRWTRPTVGPAGPLSCRSPAHEDGRAPDSHRPRFTRWVCSRSNVEVTCNRARRHVRRAPRLRLSG